MKFIKKIFTSRDFWPILIVLAFGLLAGKGLIGRGYFNMHDDLQMMRQLQMEKCFLDGQIPCRWVPDMGYGFGFPLFNFYPPLPYLIGEGIRLAGFAFTATAKILFIMSLVGSGLTMYFLAREFFGRSGGVIAAIFYTWAPYHAVDVYVRGAMNEAWAMVFFPMIFWSGYRLVKDRQKLFGWVVALTLSYFGLFTSHNLMLLIFTPVFGIWILFWLAREKKWSRLPHLTASGIWSLALAAFFTVPALVENKFTQIESVLIGYYDYIAHFVDVNQLFISRFWGYGPSVWGSADDRMSFQIGYLHWGGSLVVLLLLITQVIKRKKPVPAIWAGFYLLLTGWAAAFLTHSKSTFIWQLISPLKYLQFPWRFLTLVVFAFSFLLGVVAWVLETAQTRGKVSRPQKYYLLGLLVTGALILNWSYFLPEHGRLGSLTDAEKFSGAAWDLQQTAGIYDYLPVTARTAPKAPQKNLGEFVSQEGKIIDAGQVQNPAQGTRWASFEVLADEEVNVRLGIFQFPGWKITVDGQEVSVSVPEVEEWGRMWIKVPAGRHLVQARFVNTPVRTISNLVSLAGWLVLVSAPVWKKRFSVS